jgi:hypothetical protein
MTAGGTTQGSEPDRHPAGHASTAVAAVLAAALLVVVLVTWAAAIGPGDVLRGDGVPIRTAVPTDEPTTETPSGTPTLSDGERLEQARPDGVADWVRTVGFLLELATLLLALYLLWRGLRWARETYDARDRGAPAPPDLDFDVIDTPAALDEVRRDADVQRRLLEEGPPRDAIVACWERFETQAQAARLGRRPWETSAEFTLRFLDLVSADEHAVARLAELYREARFSDHEMGEPARLEARDALARIHAGLVRPATGGRS